MTTDDRANKGASLATPALGDHNRRRSSNAVMDISCLSALSGNTTDRALARHAFMTSLATARAKSGGTAFPTCRNPRQIVGSNWTQSGNE